jgi:hypothetical protein
VFQFHEVCCLNENQANFAFELGRESRAAEVELATVKIALTELLKLQKSDQFPDEPVRIKV